MGYSDSIATAYQSADLLGAQLAEGRRLARRVKLPPAYRRSSEVLVCAMGGSALGADIVRHALAGSLKKSISIVNGYHLPAWASKRTLVVCASYSGATAETIQCFREAAARRLPLVAVAGGKALARAALRARVPLVQFDDQLLNPSRQPRLGLGLGVGALFGLLEKIGALPTQGQQQLRIPATPAKAARTLAGRAIVVVGVGYLAGAAHAVANCINENSKTFAAPFSLPEIDHHLLEGLRLPQQLGAKLGVLVLAPRQLEQALATQLRATASVLAKHKLRIVTQRFGEASGPLAAALAATAWGTSLSIALAEIAKLDPLAIPWVTWLKQQQARRR